jgi:hypothetical protein
MYEILVKLAYINEIDKLNKQQTLSIPTDRFEIAIFSMTEGFFFQLYNDTPFKG